MTQYFYEVLLCITDKANNQVINHHTFLDARSSCLSLFFYLNVLFFLRFVIV